MVQSLQVARGLFEASVGMTLTVAALPWTLLLLTVEKVPPRREQSLCDFCTRNANGNESKPKMLVTLRKL